ncbi:MAG TPA: anthranilate phosphoribosyltransferase [Candidatus Thioglobus sp.]|jgi:anthranilate phosphoribosyltransferase|nr:anthranilate phosphoribosyltransferase [Candidatus Thioglobus sp.]HIL42358.1 anthranilate phosphoribosyltransferase [Gammaproteobacteria bacterium]
MDSDNLMHSIIQRIATGPDLSKDIEFDEAKDAMQAVIRGEIDDVQSAIFLIALRMKRETMDENEGVLSAVLAESDQQLADVDDLVDLGDPYSGYNRSVPISSFLPPLLAELGLPTVIHGLDSVSPKYGLTHRHINESLGLEVDHSSSDAKLRLLDHKVGWTYIDQNSYCKGLHNLVHLRNRIVKRTVINTIETLIGPLRGSRTHSILGYVHKPYPPIYANLASVSGMNTSLLIRGVEGGVVPSLRQKGLMISYRGSNEDERVDIDPKSIGIEQDLRAISFPTGMGVKDNLEDLADYTVELGREALSGKKGMFYDGLLYSSSLILWHLKKVNSLQDGSELVRSVLDSGNAINRLT